MIEARNLTKDYGTVVAVKDVSFSVGKGEVVGFLGPNGAGKSTTLRMLAGFLGATSGSISINGHDIVDDAIAARRAIGYMPEASPLYPELRVKEYLRYRAELKRVPRKERGKAVDRAMDLAAVQDMRDTLIAHLSKGYRQRVGLADALVSNPPLLILDEPTAGLDPNQIREVRSLVRDLREEHTILLSTHILPEVEAVCERAVVIHQGQLVAEGTLEELRDNQRAEGATLLVSVPSAATRKASALLDELKGVRRVRRSGGGSLKGGSAKLERLKLSFAKSAEPGAVLEQAVRALVEAGFGVREAAPDKATLEQIFAQLTGKEFEE